MAIDFKDSLNLPSTEFSMKANLPQRGIALREIPRLEIGVPVSASAVREALEKGDDETLRSMLPLTTYNYLKDL